LLLTGFGGLDILWQSDAAPSLGVFSWNLVDSKAEAREQLDKEDEES
jgi:hypothetical protein